MPCPGMSLNELQGHNEAVGDPKVNKAMSSIKTGSYVMSMQSGLDLWILNTQTSAHKEV